VWVTNRSFEKAQKLADLYGWEAHALSDLPQLLTQVDIVISSTGATQPVFTKELIAPLLPKRKYRPLFLIDIAVPRDVDPAVAKIDNVFVYDIDDLESVTRKAVESRSKDVAKAVELVDVEVQQHLKWAQNLSVTPTIAALRKRSMELVSSEAERLSHRDEALRQQLERYGQALINKLLHEPSVAMKDPHDGARLADSARKLFNLADLQVLDGERGTEAPAADEPPERQQA
jgi:glutamyl-tRNA reductase